MVPNNQEEIVLTQKELEDWFDVVRIMVSCQSRDYDGNRFHVKNIGNGNGNGNGNGKAPPRNGNGRH